MPFSSVMPRRKTPEIAVAVVVEHGGHGGGAAAPVARKIIDAYFKGRDEQKKAQEGET